jgi:3-dehydroquinate dehydratase
MLEVEDKLRDAANVEGEEKLADTGSAEGEDKLADAANVENEDEVAVTQNSSEVEGKLADAVQTSRAKVNLVLQTQAVLRLEGKPADAAER